jgi:hypothetical protein
MQDVGVKATIDYHNKIDDQAIGVYYGSLIREREYGIGLHPKDYPDSLINCNDQIEVAYEVAKA